MPTPSRTGFAWLLASLAALACAEPQGTVGEHVEIRSKLVDQVCEGTVAQLDAEVERIAAELELPIPAERFVIEVLADGDNIDRCGDRDEGCMTQPPRRVYVPAGNYDEIARFELARAQLDASLPDKTKALIFEGSAAALTLPSCTFAEGYPRPDLQTLLRAGFRSTLEPDGRYVGGELLRWLLDTHGPGPVLGWAGELPWYAGVHEVRASYAARFGGRIDDELFAHLRPNDAPIEAGRVGCTAPAPALGDVDRELRIRADFDCGSARVRNDFRNPDQVFVEWTLAVAPNQAGPWTLLGELDERVSVTLSACDCYDSAWSQWFDWFELPWVTGGSQWLDPGRYRLRARGPIGASVDLRLEMACDVLAQDCPDRMQCIVGSCVAEADEPAGLGQPCAPTWGAEPAACEAGLICVGPSAGQGVCVPACSHDPTLACADAEVCLYELACVATCDPLAADACPPTWVCIDGYDGEFGCVPGGDAGLLERCSWDACGPGLTCARLPAEVCEDPDEPGEADDCCTPYCDPNADDPGCPPQLPTCATWADDDPVGQCEP